MREGRRPDELRPLTIDLDYLEQPHGAVLFSQGKTKVLCTATIEEEIPRWLKGQGTFVFPCEKRTAPCGCSR